MAVVFPTAGLCRSGNKQPHKRTAVRCGSYSDPRKSLSLGVQFALRHRVSSPLDLWPGSAPSVVSEVSLSTHSRPWLSWWGQRKLGHLYLFVSGYADAAHPTNHPRQGHALPSGSPPHPTSFCVFALPSPPRCHREHPCSSPLLLSTGTPQKSQISLQFPVQCLFGGKRAGGRAALKKEPHSQTVWAAFEGKHVQEGVCEASGKRDWGLCVLVLTHRSHLSRDTEHRSVQAPTATV